MKEKDVEKIENEMAYSVEDIVQRMWERCSSDENSFKGALLAYIGSLVLHANDFVEAKKDNI